MSSRSLLIALAVLALAHTAEVWINVFVAALSPPSAWAVATVPLHGATVPLCPHGGMRHASQSCAPVAAAVHREWVNSRAAESVPARLVPARLAPLRERLVRVPARLAPPPTSAWCLVRLPARLAPLLKRALCPCQFVSLLAPVAVPNYSDLVVCVQGASHGNSTEPACCAAKHDPVSCNSTEATDHWCNYLDADYYAKVQAGGIATTIALGALMVIIVVLRDIMKVWDCFGATTSAIVMPDRQLTTMSAAYAPETMPGMDAKPNFQTMGVPMGAMPMGSMPMMGMPMMGSYPGMPVMAAPAAPARV